MPAKKTFWTQAAADAAIFRYARDDYHALWHMYDEATQKGSTCGRTREETRELFKKIGLKNRKSPTIYTSVHYVVNANSEAKATCEIQVRTLMEEGGGKWTTQ
jgi:hypothetical protein